MPCNKLDSRSYWTCLSQVWTRVRLCPDLDLTWILHPLAQTWDFWTRPESNLAKAGLITPLSFPPFLPFPFPSPPSASLFPTHRISILLQHSMAMGINTQSCDNFYVNTRSVVDAHAESIKNDTAHRITIRARNVQSKAEKTYHFLTNEYRLICNRCNQNYFQNKSDCVNKNCVQGPQKKESSQRCILLTILHQQRR
jgi:hypothetical protein